MKKLLAIALIVVFAGVSLASCGKTVVGGGDVSDSDTYNESDVYNDGTLDNNGALDNGTEDNTEDIIDDNTDNGGADVGNTDNNDEDDKNDNNEDAKPQEKPTFNVKESTTGLKFKLNEDKLSYTLVSKGTATAKAIVIDGHNGLPVTKIGYSAFGDNKTITSVKLGDYVEIIEDQAFSMCSALTSVTFGKNVKFLGDYSFRYCNGLTSIDLGRNIEVIKYGAFYNCKNLATVKMYDKVKLIEEYAFDKSAYFNNSSNWKNKVLYIGTNLIKAKSDISGTYTVASGTTCIGGWAFYGCKSLSGIVIPDSVHSIGNRALCDATSLNNITVGNGVTYVGEKAFYNTKYYNTSSKWTNNVLYVGKSAVAAKTSLSGTCTLNSGTKAIADMAFNNCKSLSAIVIPDSVVYIGEYAFLGCEKLASVTVGSGAKEIGVYAFKDCTALKNITMKKTSGWKADKTEVSTDKLSNKADAAIYLGIYYSDKIWTRG